MKLSNPNREKLSIRRAILWANVYHTISDAMKERPTASMDIIHTTSRDNADRAMAAFDERFPLDMKIEAAGVSAPGKGKK